ncbi:hypothetical protein CVT24_013001 [Panaeolus cyanescens]|uniref:Glycogen [starch] synthase n=1 Tax=Panaeolus cyanescens TaxID=181874 RepID=A0A409VVT2_9AGAR|nr:hypothetical protein CVT24_013001 [Panaeolus cyanescens]
MGVLQTVFAFTPVLLATYLAVHGLRKRSLSPSGALAAFFVGSLMFSGGSRAFGVGLLALYLVASRATKYGNTKKARLEEDYHSAGYRTAAQVFCNSASGFVACIAWNALFAPQSVHAGIVKWIGADRALNAVAVFLTGKATASASSQEGWCPIRPSFGDGGLSRALVFAALGHFACCLGDTLASELGILSRSKPRLITTFKVVPPGTNGGVSVGGTLASIAGGVIVGGTMGASILLENTRSCSSWDMMACVVLGAVLGGSGSLIDSLLGATIQETRYSKDKGKISSHGSVINGWNWLSNNQVRSDSEIVKKGIDKLSLCSFIHHHHLATFLLAMADEKRDVHNPLLFECAWEVANKVGGIYTVIKTKVPVTVSEFGDRYCLIGPLSYKTAPMEVEAEEPTDEHLAASLESMRAQGVKALYGRWLIEGNPRVLLFDPASMYSRLDEWKGDLWNLAGIPSPPNDQETNETIIFGYLVAWFLGDYLSRQLTTAVVAHFHEWQAGLAIPLCRKRHLDVTTVFTTHATLLGRYLCAGSVDFYNNLQYFDVDHEAGKRGIYHRYCIERSATHCADVFTTVSHITAFESEHLLKRKPDGVLPNGLNVRKFQAIHEFQNLHAQSKAKINEFIRGHFYGHYDFDLDNTLYLFTAGRYEYRNKGVDMFIESLARLNYKLQKAGSTVTVVAFIIMPAATHSYTIEALKGQAVTKQLRDTVTEIQNRIGARLFDHAARFHGEPNFMPTPDQLLSEEDQVLLKRRIFALKRNSLPPIVTHNMADDSNDPILSQIRRVKLFNNSHDRVKIVFHPDFLNSNNPILGLDYEEFVRGCHLGVFPSYYEPWGYTPAECTVMGIPSITTNLSGFGCFMQDLIENPEEEGCYIIDRRMQSVEDSVNQLTDHMFSFTQKTRRQRINQRNRVERLSPLLDWKNLGIEYSKARQLALRRAYPDQFEDVDGFGFGEGDWFGGGVEMLRPANSMPASPRLRGAATPGDMGTLTEDMQALDTSDYRGWPKSHEVDEEDSYPFPLVMKFRSRSRSGSVISGASTPGGGAFRSLSEGDLLRADAALSQVNGSIDTPAPANGHS